MYKRQARASGLTLQIDLGALPLADGVADVARQLGRRRAPRHAAGEDYELLVCVAPEDRASAASAAPLTWIGEVRDGRPEVVLLSDGIAQTARGFQHRL